MMHLSTEIQYEILEELKLRNKIEAKKLEILVNINSTIKELKGVE